MASYYEPSGKVSALSYLLLALSIFIIFPLLGLAYTYAIWYIPIIYVNVLVTIGFGIAAGFVIKHVILYYGKVRNPKAAVLIGILASLVLYYVSWAIYADLNLNITDTIGGDRFGVAVSNVNVDETIGLALHPSRVFSIMGLLYKWGSWGIFGFTMSGFMLAIIWIAEFLIIMILAVTTSYEISKRPFCELSNSWFKENKVGPFVYVLDRPALVNDLESSSRNTFDNLEFTQNDQRDHTMFKLYDNGQGKAYLTAESHKARMNDGKLEFDISPFVERIEITEDMKQSLLSKMNA